MAAKQPSRVVFVGNIPYTQTEEAMIDLLSKVGRVVNFRLVYDRENGRPKGFGFAEFPDPDTAASAVRNLNNAEIEGRKLRVDFSNDNAAEEADKDSYPRGNGTNGHGSNSYTATDGFHSSGSVQLPPLPPGRELPPGVTCTDAISQTLQTLPPTQLLEFIRAMREMAVADTERCMELLNQMPQLAYAVFQALLLMGLVSPDIINAVLDPHSALPRPQLFVPGQQPQQPQPQPAAAAAAAAYPYGQVPTTTPPVVMPGGFAPPPPAPAAAAAAAAVPDAEQLMRAVLELTDEQVGALPPVEREQIRALRAQFGRQ